MLQHFVLLFRFWYFSSVFVFVTCRVGLRWEGNPGDTGERKERGWPGASRVGVAGMPDIVFVFVFVLESFCTFNCTWIFLYLGARWDRNYYLDWKVGGRRDGERGRDFGQLLTIGI